jgi:hypothetical protein
MELLRTVQQPTRLPDLGVMQKRGSKKASVPGVLEDTRDRESIAAFSR